MNLKHIIATISATVSLLGLLGAGFLWGFDGPLRKSAIERWDLLAEEDVARIVSEALSEVAEDAEVDLGPCLVFFDAGHSVQDTPRGDWGEVSWLIDKRRDDCGSPLVTAVIKNHGGILHRAPLSIGDGINLPVGVQDIPYLFLVPCATYQGDGELYVSVTYPTAPDRRAPVYSPSIPFEILADRAGLCPEGTAE
ncbi:MAG: hypothetical protein AAGK37_19405 [Pseudomonadota bacterium]